MYVRIFTNFSFIYCTLIIKLNVKINKKNLQSVFFLDLQSLILKTINKKKNINIFL
jgi:hypothetical protein